VAERSPADWDLIYDLAKDRWTVRAIQEASLGDDGYGFPPDDPALFGTPEWWDAVATGAVQTVDAIGTISEVYWSGHNDYPEFAVRTADGSVTRWGRLGDVTRYVDGLGVRLRYAVLTAKPNPKFDAVLPDHRQKILLQVWIERSSKRNLDMGDSGLRPMGGMSGVIRRVAGVIRRRRE
jgi:hypothetical protein